VSGKRGLRSSWSRESESEFRIRILGNKSVTNNQKADNKPICSPITNSSPTPPPRPLPLAVDPHRSNASLLVYMSGGCLECGQNTQWDGELGSSVCTTCGTLSNPTQTTLASHLGSYETSSGHGGSFTWDLGNPTLKSIRNKDGRALSGQGREVRHRQNMVRFFTLLYHSTPVDADAVFHTSSPLTRSSHPYAIGCLTPGWRAGHRHCSVKQ